MEGFEGYGPEQNIETDDDTQVSECCDLLPCKTCGGNPVRMQSFFGKHYFECKRCGRMSSLFGHNTVEEAEHAWNADAR